MGPLQKVREIGSPGATRRPGIPGRPRTLASANPVAANTTEDGRALNRRTDIKVVLNAQ